MSLLPLPVPGASAAAAAGTGRETARTVVEGGADAKSNPFPSFLPVPASAAGKGMPGKPTRAPSAALGGAAVKFIPATSRFPEPVTGIISIGISGLPPGVPGVSVCSVGPAGSPAVSPAGGAGPPVRRETTSPLFTPELQHGSSTGGGTPSFHQQPSSPPATPPLT